MLKVEVIKGNIEKALKIYKNKVNRTKQTKKLREDRYHEKEPQANRKKLAKAKYTQDKHNQQDNKF
jgi:ribosomal protein S21